GNGRAARWRSIWIEGQAMPASAESEGGCQDSSHDPFLPWPLRRARRCSRSEIGFARWCFNPRLAPKSEAISDHRGGFAGDIVSIRAWLRRARRYGQKSRRTLLCRFQSAPRSEERGDAADSGRETSNWLFQSAPRSEERGDLRTLAGRRATGCFNPRLAP